MTELDFLLDLLLEHKLPKPVQELIRNRVKIVQQQPVRQATFQVPSLAQAPSTLANLSRASGENTPIVAAPIVPVEPVIPHTTAAAQALARRQQAINEGIKGPPSRGGPPSSPKL